LLVADVVPEDGDLGGQRAEDGGGDQLPPGRTDEDERRPRRAEGGPGEGELRQVVARAPFQQPARRIRDDSSA
jgi:hypothetical protein